MRQAEKEKLRCPYCGTQYISTHRLDVHIKSLHFQPVYRCPRCLALFGEAADLESHKKACK